jgi:3-methyladenine DNA glycosylase AlkC
MICLTALNGMRNIYNPIIVNTMNQIYREKEHLLLMWADQHPKTALQGETNKNYNTVASEDWEKLDKGETGRNKTSRMNII